MSKRDPILPGATLGVFGGGQLGRMFASAAARMGYRVLVLAPDCDPPAGHVAHEHVRADYLDESAVRDFARRCDAVTLEFENVPVRTLDVAAEDTRVRPGREVLAIAQDRILEREFLSKHGFPTSPFVIVRAPEDCETAVERLGMPFVLKTARLGYDGKGQRRVEAPGDVYWAWAELSERPSLAEAWVDFACELSVVVARAPSGAIQTFGPILNEHRDHILDLSVVPADVPRVVERRAHQLAREIAEHLGLEGLMCVEMFLGEDGDLLVNELAPRPHNSGHLTIEGCNCSQFEQQVRAICDLPLGSMATLRPTAMANLLGDLWSAREPDWLALLRDPEVSLHLYGKTDSRPGRKMGHVTATGATVDEARRAVIAARRSLITRDVDHEPSRPEDSEEMDVSLLAAFAQWGGD
jgi:5-(carboxyamino)imidazole ribonucleotide synthase